MMIPSFDSRLLYDIEDYNMSADKTPKDKINPESKRSFTATLTVIVRDKNGKVIYRHKQKSHSPTQNFINLMVPFTWFNSTGKSLNIVNTSNSSTSWEPYLPYSSWQYGNGISYPNTGANHQVYTLGIVVGSGTQSNPYTAYNLALPIANGSGTGQLVYGTPSLPSGITASGSEAYFIISQTFTNNSGGTITITEVGLEIYLVFTYVTSYPTTVGNTLVWYDVLSSPISVSNGSSVTIYYTFAVNP